MFITLGIPSTIGKGSINMFIKLEIFCDVDEGNVVLIKCNTTVETIPRVLIPKYIPPNLSDKTMESITPVHGIHC